MWLCRFSARVLLLCVFTFQSYADDTATILFANNSPLVFQIRVIDKGSGNKSIIGSGFQISPSGVIATNYHVVSEYLLERDKYTPEVLNQKKNSIKASIINFDIVHDLALLQVSNLEPLALKLSGESLAQGNRIYSMGNPNDLGMTIVEGTYNGLVEASRYNKYLFSGSLNPGMSGGPVFNSAGEVIGINVSKGGEQISFLVPARYLIELVSRGFEPVNADEYNAHALDYLLKDQDAYYNMLLGSEWVTKTFQNFELPDKIHTSLKCWGHSEESDDRLFEETHRHCKSEDEIFIKSDFNTGAFVFSYESITSEQLNSNQFYKLLEQNYEIQSFVNSDKKEDTTNFVCSTDFLYLGGHTNLHHMPWKVTSCIREYIDYDGLYDAGLIAMYADTTDGKHDALVIKITNTGISKSNIKNLYNKFMGTVKWTQ